MVYNLSHFKDIFFFKYQLCEVSQMTVLQYIAESLV